MTKEIALTRGKFSLVNEEDFESLNCHKWYFDGRYAVRWEKRNFYHREKIMMHRAILNPNNDLVIDHINGNTLDNRRENLRVCSRAENMHNMKKHADNTSGFKGVTWSKRARKWQAQIQVSSRKVYIGQFSEKIDAAIAYDKRALEIFGVYAKVNFEDGQDPEARGTEKR